VSNKVPGQAEKWDDVIRQLTSVWTPESAARVLAAIAQLDLQGSSSEGDVLTRVGDRFVPRPSSGGGGGGPWALIDRLVWSGDPGADWEVDGLPQAYDDLLLVLDTAGSGSGLNLSDQDGSHAWDTVQRLAVGAGDEVAASAAGGTAAFTNASDGLTSAHAEILLMGYTQSVRPVLLRADIVARGAAGAVASVRVAGGQQSGTGAFGAIVDIFFDTGGDNPFTAGDVLSIYGRGGT
jgi:hypothetical protein